MNQLAILTAATLASLVLTAIVRGYALTMGIIDIPNARSSHQIPTPRGGGIAIVVTTVVGTGMLMISGTIPSRMLLVLVLTSLMNAVIGYLDDKQSLPALPRFTVHLASSALFVGFVAASYPNGQVSSVIHWLVAGVFVIGLAWSISLFNFMDGIDGIAASQAVFVTASGAALALANEHQAYAALLFLTMGSCLGFLMWNWPPAKIFMGDVGSGFLGFWLAGLGILLHVFDVLSIWTSIVLGSLFVADATSTLLVRVIAGGRWYEAHRTHAYQHLARRWGAHSKVVAFVCCMNVLVVLPLAALTMHVERAAPAISITTVVVFGLLAFTAGAGRDGPSGEKAAR